MHLHAACKPNERKGIGQTVNAEVGQWVSLGPTRINAGLGACGRLTAIAIEPTSPPTMYVGAPGSGVWKTLMAARPGGLSQIACPHSPLRRSPLTHPPPRVSTSRRRVSGSSALKMLVRPGPNYQAISRPRCAGASSWFTQRMQTFCIWLLLWASIVPVISAQRGSFPRAAGVPPTWS